MNCCRKADIIEKTNNNVLNELVINIELDREKSDLTNSLYYLKYFYLEKLKKNFVITNEFLLIILVFKIFRQII